LRPVTARQTIDEPANHRTWLPAEARMIDWPVKSEPVKAT
jgi:hypothetical protein